MVEILVRGGEIVIHLLAPLDNPSNNFSPPYSSGAIEAIALAKSRWKNGVSVDKMGVSLEAEDSANDRFPAS